MTLRPRNALLEALPDDAFSSLAEHLAPVELRLSDRVHKAEVSIEWVYFPEASLLSMIALGQPGQGVETSMVGTEGAAGLAEACGSGESSVDCVVQVDGLAWRVRPSVCRDLAAANQGFAEAAWRSAELQIVEARQSAVCHALHPIDQRLARWLLESVARSGGRSPLPMTQEFLSAMLGVQRTTVTAVAARLQSLGIIKYSRGRLEVLDHVKLEAMACGCVKSLRAQRARLKIPSKVRRDLA